MLIEMLPVDIYRKKYLKRCGIRRKDKGDEKGGDKIILR